MQASNAEPARRRAAGTPASLRQDVHLAVITFPAALGGYPGVVGELHMNDSALTGRHRLQREGPPGVGDALSHTVGQRPQRLVAPLAVAFDVDVRLDPVLDLAAENEVDEELEGRQGLATPADEESGILAVDVEGEVVPGLARPGADWGLWKADRGLDAHDAKDVLDGSLGQVDQIAGPEVDPDFRLAGAEAQDPGAPLIDDHDLDVVAADAELR